MKKPTLDEQIGMVSDSLRSMPQGMMIQGVLLAVHETLLAVKRMREMNKPYAPLHESYSVKCKNCHYTTVFVLPLPVAQLVSPARVPVELLRDEEPDPNNRFAKGDKIDPSARVFNKPEALPKDQLAAVPMEDQIVALSVTIDYCEAYAPGLSSKYLHGLKAALKTLRTWYRAGCSECPSVPALKARIKELEEQRSRYQGELEEKQRTISGSSLFGFAVVESTSRVGGGKLILGGITKKFDRNGNMISREAVDYTTLEFK